MNEHARDAYRHLQKSYKMLAEEIPGPASSFADLHRAALDEGALPRKVKELIALGISVCVGCSGCIANHLRGALRAGASREEIVEAIGVSILMGGGPSTVYGAEAFEALEAFETDKNR